MVGVSAKGSNTISTGAAQEPALSGGADEDDRRVLEFGKGVVVDSGKGLPAKERVPGTAGRDGAGAPGAMEVGGKWVELIDGLGLGKGDGLDDRVGNGVGRSAVGILVEVGVGAGVLDVEGTRVKPGGLGPDTAGVPTGCELWRLVGGRFVGVETAEEGGLGRFVEGEGLGAAVLVTVGSGDEGESLGRPLGVPPGRSGSGIGGVGLPTGVAVGE